MTSPIVQAVGAVLEAMPVTVGLVVVALSVGGALAVFYCWLQEVCGIAVARFVAIWTLALRGSPLLVQLYLVYYGLAQFSAVRSSVAWPILKDPFWCAALVLALNASAYTLEIFRGGIQSVVAAEVEAARAFGMNRWQQYKSVIAPQAFRYCLPAFGNQTVAMVKNTALASTITVMEMTGAAQRIMSSTFAAFEVFLVAGTAYLIANVLLTRPIGWLERRLRTGQSR